MPDILTSYAESQPDKPAVIDDRGSGEPVRWTYRELEERSNRLANALVSLGVGPGEKVIWCGPNSPQLVAAIGATRKIGAVSVPLNYRLTADEARYVIGHSDASVAYVDADHAPMFAALQGSLDRLRHVIVFGGPAPDGMLGEDFVDGSPADPPADPAGQNGPATMIFTSGTTGKPKGAVRTTRAAADETLIGLIVLIGYTPDDVYLTS